MSHFGDGLDNGQEALVFPNSADGDDPAVYGQSADELSGQLPELHLAAVVVAEDERGVGDALTRRILLRCALQVPCI